MARNSYTRASLDEPDAGLMAARRCITLAVANGGDGDAEIAEFTAIWQELALSSNSWRRGGWRRERAIHEEMSTCARMAYEAVVAGRAAILRRKYSRR